ncbi:Os07g0217500 [Oryza sativa Japonica Group]|uniref:Os07g0217500 protein n=1 Tax=Oryza sativa subsp. japonica TaxID=39947 RepID=A0A0P0X3V2_ORYSJ|nr:Os07g0217500 [Oryza sativa Japonica Group]
MSTRWPWSLDLELVTNVPSPLITDVCPPFRQPGRGDSEANKDVILGFVRAELTAMHAALRDLTDLTPAQLDEQAKAGASHATSRTPSTLSWFGA